MDTLKLKSGVFKRIYSPLTEIKVKGGCISMPVNQKKQRTKLNHERYFRCKDCGKPEKTLTKGYCKSCYEVNTLMDAYGRRLEARGILPSLETNPKAYYPKA